MNLFSASSRIADNGVALIAGENQILLNSVPVDFRAGSSVTIGIRPEHLDITDADNADISARVDFAEQLGGETYLYCSADGIEQLTVHQLGQLPVDKGTTLHLKIDQEKMHIFNENGRVLAKTART